MTSGGARPGAGRPAIVSLRDRLLIGKACEKDWQKYVDLGGARPYRHRGFIISKHATRAGWAFDKKLSERFVESCWSRYRKLIKDGGEVPPV